MRTVHCLLCGLRYAHASELDVHAREEHAPPPVPEGQETLVRQRRRVAVAGRHAVRR